jgi:hypothetical protein
VCKAAGAWEHKKNKTPAADALAPNAYLYMRLHNQFDACALLSAPDETFSALTWLSASAIAVAVSAGLLDLLHHAWANGPDHDLDACAAACAALVAPAALAACTVALAAG